MARSPEAATRGAGGRHGSPWRAAGTGLVAVLALLGAGLIGASLKQPPSLRPPQPVAEAAPPELEPATDPSPLSAEPGTPPSPSATAIPGPVGRSRSEPTDISIPKIGVAAKIISLGVNADGTIQVPPLERAQLAGWYQPGPSPGEVGNSVIVGHVDSYAIGPAVFFRLGELKPGDTVLVTRKDRTVVRFRVDGVKAFPKTAFPTEQVYGASEQPSLRLVTCGGKFNEKTRSYPDNIIVFATLIP
ncbi:class F sortase [Micromonospora sp. NPDC049559]|uniref:class F sortase n=1 Tax=Micromonospora sp. NPDC049559 TaxID=3155923 RepID=UPI00341C1479